MSRLIRVDADVYRRVMVTKVQMEAQEHRSVSMGRAVRRAINLAAATELVHEHAIRVDHRFGRPCSLGPAHEGCCPGICAGRTA